MSRYEAYDLRRRYLWSAACREGQNVFYPEKYRSEAYWEAFARRRWSHRYFRACHATMQWFGGERFVREDHWSMRAIR